MGNNCSEDKLGKHTLAYEQIIAAQFYLAKKKVKSVPASPRNCTEKMPQASVEVTVAEPTPTPQT